MRSRIAVLAHSLLFVTTGGVTLGCAGSPTLKEQPTSEEPGTTAPSSSPAPSASEVDAVPTAAATPSTDLDDAPSSESERADAAPVPEANTVDASSAEPARASGQPADFDTELAWPIPEDHDPDPQVIDIDIEARTADLEIVPGTLTPTWTYDGAIPGPLIRATVGQKVIVHFKNSLPEPTSVHWHGLRVNNDVDGVPGVTQKLIEPGDSYVYEFTLRDAGTYWYHPHYDSVWQMGRGMYGGIVVTEPDEPDLGEELVLVLSDMSIKQDGQFVDEELGGDLLRMFGREGEVLLVNGKVNPTLRARAGLRQHWRVINASRTRYYGLDFAGQSFVQVGGDGGKLERPVTLETPPVLVPGGRKELVIEPSGTPGSTAQVQWVATERGFGSTFNRPNVDLFRVSYSEEEPGGAEALPELSRQIPAPELDGASEHDLELTIDIPDGGLMLGINHDVGEAVPPIMAQVGETQIWNLTNHSDFSHPFHLHGFFFQAIDELGNPTEPRQWRDTIDVPIDELVRIAVKFDERPGMWMYHCHILDHAEGGMMGMVHLEQP